MAAVHGGRAQFSTESKVAEETMSKKLDTALKRTNHVPYIVLSRKGSIQRMAVWSDVKEVLFFWCVNSKCNIVLGILKQRFNYPVSEKYLKPCTQSEHLQFLRQFIIVAPGTLLVDLVCLQNRKTLMDIYDAVKLAHARSSDPSAVLCNIQQAKELSLLNYSFPMPANIMVRKKFLPAVSRHTTLKNGPEKSSSGSPEYSTDNSTESAAHRNVIVTRNKNQRAWTISQSASKDKGLNDTHPFQSVGKLPISSVLYGVGDREAERALVPLSLLKESFPQALGLLEEVAQTYVLQKASPDFPSVTLCSHTEGVHLTRFLISNRGYERRWCSLTTLSLLMSWSDFFQRVRQDDLRLFLKLKTVSIVVLKVKTAEILKGNKVMASPQKTTQGQTSGEVVSGHSCITQEESAQNLESIVKKNDLCDTNFKTKSKKCLKSSSSNTSQVGKSAINGQLKVVKGKSDTAVTAKYTNDRSIKNQIMLKRSDLIVNQNHTKSKKQSHEHTKGKTVNDIEKHGNRCYVPADDQEKNDGINGENIHLDGILRMTKRYNNQSRGSQISSTTSATLLHDKKECKSACDVVESVLSFSLQNKHAKHACQTNKHSKKNMNTMTKQSENSNPSENHDKMVASNNKCVTNCAGANNCKSTMKDHNNSAVGDTASNKQSNLKANENTQICSDENVKPNDGQLSDVHIDNQTASEKFDNAAQMHSGVTMVSIQKKLENQSSNNSSITENSNTLTESLVTTSVKPNKKQFVESNEKELSTSGSSSKLIPCVKVPSEGLIESLGLKFKLTCPTEKNTASDTKSVENVSATKKKSNKEQLYYWKDNPKENTIEKPESVCRIFPTYTELKPSANIRSLLPNTNEYKFPYPATRTAGICTTSCSSVPCPNTPGARQSITMTIPEPVTSTSYDMSKLDKLYSARPCSSRVGEHAYGNNALEKRPTIHTSENKATTLDHSPVKLSLQKGAPPICSTYTQCLMDRDNQDCELTTEKNDLCKSKELPLSAALSIQEKVKLIQDHYGDKMKAKCTNDVSKPDEIPFKQKVRYFKPNSSIAPTARSNRNVVEAKDNFNAKIEAVLSRDIPIAAIDKVQRFSRIVHKVPKKCPSVENNTVIYCPNYGSSSSTTPDIYDEYARKKKFKGIRQDPSPGAKFKCLPNNVVSNIFKSIQPSSCNVQSSSCNTRLINNTETTHQNKTGVSIQVDQPAWSNHAQTNTLPDVQTFDSNNVSMDTLSRDCYLCQHNELMCNDGLEESTHLKKQYNADDKLTEYQCILNESTASIPSRFHQSNDQHKICTIAEACTLANDCIERMSMTEPDSKSVSVTSSDFSLPPPTHSSTSTSLSDCSIDMQPTTSEDALSKPLHEMSLTDKWISSADNVSPHSAHSSDSLQNLSAIVNINPGQSLNNHVSETFQRLNTGLEKYACRPTESVLHSRTNAVSPPFVQTTSQSDLHVQLQGVLVPINTPLYYRTTGQNFVREVSGDTNVPPHSDYFYLANPHKSYTLSRPSVLPLCPSLQQQENVYEQKKYNYFPDKYQRSKQKTHCFDTNETETTNVIENTNTKSDLICQVNSESHNVSQRLTKQTNITKDESGNVNKLVDLNPAKCSSNTTDSCENCDDQNTMGVLPQANNSVISITDKLSDIMNTTYDADSEPVHSEPVNLPKTIDSYSDNTPFSNIMKNKDFRTTIEEKRAVERINEDKDDRSTPNHQSDRTVDKIKLVHLKSSNTEKCSYSIKKCRKKSCDHKMHRAGATSQDATYSSLQKAADVSVLEKMGKKCVRQKVPKKSQRPKTSVVMRPKTSLAMCSHPSITSKLNTRPKSCSVDMQWNRSKQFGQSSALNYDVTKQPSESESFSHSLCTASPTNILSSSIKTATGSDVSSRTLRKQNDNSDIIPIAVDQVRKRDERYESRLHRRLNDTNLKIVGDAKLISTIDTADSEEHLSPLIEARQQKLREFVETQVSKKLLKKRGRSAKVGKSSKATHRKKSSTYYAKNCDIFKSDNERKTHLCDAGATKNNVTILGDPMKQLNDSIVASTVLNELNNKGHDLKSGESNVPKSYADNIETEEVIPCEDINGACTIKRKSGVHVDNPISCDSETDAVTYTENAHMLNIENITESDENSQHQKCDIRRQYMLESCGTNCDKNNVLINGCANYGFNISCFDNEKAQNNNANNTYHQAICDISVSPDKTSDPVNQCITEANAITSTNDFSIPPNTKHDSVINDEEMGMPVLCPVNDTHSFTSVWEPTQVDILSDIHNQCVESNVSCSNSDNLIAVEQNISDDAEITYTITAGTDTKVIISNKHPHFEKILQYFQNQQMNPDNLITGQNAAGMEQSPVEDDSINQDIITIITECIVTENEEIGNDYNNASHIATNPGSTSSLYSITSETNDICPYNGFLDQCTYGYENNHQAFDINSIQPHVLDGECEKQVEPSHGVYFGSDYSSTTVEQHATNLIDCTPEHNFQEIRRKQLQLIVPDECSLVEQQDVEGEANAMIQFVVDDNAFVYYDPSSEIDFADELACGRQVVVMDNNIAHDYDNSYFIETGADELIPQENVCLSPNISGSCCSENGRLYTTENVRNGDTEADTNVHYVAYNQSTSSIMDNSENMLNGTRLPMIPGVTNINNHDNDKNFETRQTYACTVPGDIHGSSGVYSEADVDTEDQVSETAESIYDCDDDRDEDYQPDFNTLDKDEDDIYSDVAKIRASLCKFSPIKRKVAKNGMKKKKAKGNRGTACKLPQVSSFKEKVNIKKQKKSTVVRENKNLTEDQAKICQEQTRAAMFIETQQKYLNVILNSTPDNKHTPCGDGDSNIESTSIDTIKSLPEGVSVYGDRTPSKSATDTGGECSIQGECAGDDNEDGVLIDDVNNSCQYQMIDDEDNINLGGIAYYQKLALPFIYINGYKFTPLRDVLFYFNHCQAGCTIPRKTLQNHKTLVKSFSTWEQVYRLELIKMKKGPPIMTGDMLVKLDSWMVLLPELTREVVRQHRNTKLKKSKQCKVKLYKLTRK